MSDPFCILRGMKRHRRPRRSDVKTEDLLRDHTAGMRQQEIARKYNIDPSTVTDRIRTILGPEFRFKSGPKPSGIPFKTRQFAHTIKYRFGITPEQYNAMLEAQGGVCAICKKPEMERQNGAIRKLSVDHCHTTGVIRGLLCAKHNKAIGVFDDDADLLASAASYVLNPPCAGLGIVVRSAGMRHG